MIDLLMIYGIGFVVNALVALTLYLDDEPVKGARVGLMTPVWFFLAPYAIVFLVKKLWKDSGLAGETGKVNK